MEYFDFENADVHVRRIDITSRLSDQMIYQRYCNRFTLKTKVRSPFRQDRSPSFGFFKTSNGILWKDLGNNEAGDVFLFVKKHLEQNGYGHLEYPEVYKIINQDFGLGIGKLLREPVQQFAPTSNEPIRSKKKKAQIRVLQKHFSLQELDYWNEYRIGYPYLKMYNVGAARTVYLNNKITHMTSVESPVFFYYFPLTDSVKVYRPFAKTEKKKWLSNVNSTADIQGWVQCNFGKKKIKTLVLTKAMKEVMFFRTFGIDAIAIQGEGHYYTVETINFLKEHCERLVSLYDRDKQGIKSSRFLWKTHKIIPFLIDKKFKAKNITDLWLTSPYDCYKIINRLLYESRTS